LRNGIAIAYEQFFGKALTDMAAFDFGSFYKALAATVAARGLTWKQVSEETRVSQSTLSRMGKGRQPDAESLTALAVWSGLNPAEFYSGSRREAEPIALVGKLLRDDPNLDSQSADALAAMLQAAYAQLRREPT
jgi:transcriptional regulator with XRE-family HTH domain